MSWLIKHQVALVFFSSLFAFSVFSFGYHFKGYVSSPSEYINLHYSQLFANENRLSYREPLNEAYDTFAFGTRGDLYFEGNLSGPASFPGFPLYLGLLRKISDHLLYVAMPLLFLATAIYFFGLAKQLFSEQTAYLGTLLFSGSHPVLLIGNTLQNNLAVALAFIAFVYYWYDLHYGKTFKALTNLCLMLFWIGFGIFIRLDFLIFPLLFLLVFWKHNNWNVLKKLAMRYYIVLALVFSLIAAVYVATDYAAYGRLFGYFTADHSINFNPYFHEDTEAQKGIQMIWRFLGEIDIRVLATNFFFHLFLPTAVFSVAGISGLVRFRKGQEAFIRKLLIVWAIAALFYLRHQWSSSFEMKFTALTPEMRYMLPAFFILVLALLAFWEKWKIPASVKSFVLLVFVSGNIFLAFFEPNGFAYLVDRYAKIPPLKQKIATTDDNAIFMTQRRDVYIYPNRKTFIYPIETPQKSCAIAEKIIEGDTPLYLMREQDHLRFFDTCPSLMPVETDFTAPFVQVQRKTAA